MARRHVALMRGINVGGKNRLRMDDLIACFDAVGCSAVRTHIQSGNVVFEASTTVVDTVGHEVPRLIEERFGFRVPVVVRRAADFQEAITANPFLSKDIDPTHLHVGFLAELPSASAIASLDPERSSVDEYVVRGQEVYLHVPGGLARTKLTTAYFDRRLGTTMTVRNWRTVNRIAEILGGD